ncbi:MAG: DNA polymerase III subunit delta' [Acidimicrobiia bacterium]
MADVLDRVVGQPDAVAQLRAAVDAPVHAYLLVGPPGAGARGAATAFAAALLCPDGGCGQCRDCRLVLGGEHPDVVVLTPEGAFLRREDAGEIIRLATRSPVEGARKVLVLADMHRVQDAGPMLLKTIEEPPPSTVFVVLADTVPEELVTIASRCVRIDLPPLPDALVAGALEADGHPPALAEQAARASGGDLDRARLLASDDRLAGRTAAWRSVPDRLDGTGAVVATVVAELRGLIDDAFAPLAARQAEQVRDLDALVAARGERGSGRRRLEEGHRREQRRHRAEELRYGLATLAARYRDALLAGTTRGDERPTADGPALLGAIAAIDRAARALARNPNETLLLESLLLRLPPLR